VLTMPLNGPQMAAESLRATSGQPYRMRAIRVSGAIKIWIMCLTCTNEHHLKIVLRDVDLWRSFVAPPCKLAPAHVTCVYACSVRVCGVVRPWIGALIMSKPFAGFEDEGLPPTGEFDTEAEAVGWLREQGPQAFVEDTPGKRMLWFEGSADLRVFRSESLFEES
jgi:hypothetical protein